MLVLTHVIIWDLEEPKEQQDYKGAIVLFSLTIHLRSEKLPDSSVVMSLTQIREELPVLCQST